MDEGEQLSCEGALTISEFVRSQVHKQERQDSVAKASWLLCKRIVDAFGSIYALRQGADHAWDIDGMVILRASYDATIQLLFMVHDSEKRVERATQFLDFLWIEKHNLRKRLDTSQTAVAKQVASSQRRPSGERELDEQLRRVGERYLTKESAQVFSKEGRAYLTSPKAKYRANWYPGSLRDLARAVGYESEYELFHKDASANVHASPLPLEFGPTIRRRYITLWASIMALRASGAVAETFGVTLNDDYRETIQLARRNIYDL